MINLEYYYITESEVEAILRQKQTGDFPYVLTVKTKAGRDYTVAYEDQQSRDDLAYAIEAKMKTYAAERNPSLDSLRRVMHDEVDKLRPYLLRIEKTLKEVIPDE